MAKSTHALLLSIAIAMTTICSPLVQRVCANTGEASANNLDTAIAASKIIDLTHVLGPDLPDFHEGAVAFTYEPLYTVKKDGYANGKFCTPEHYGTHVDAPTHFFDGKASIDKLPIENFVRPCVVIDVRDEVKNNADYQLTLEKIQALEKKDKIPTGSVVLLLTGWAQRWQNCAPLPIKDGTGSPARIMAIVPSK